MLKFNGQRKWNTSVRVYLWYWLVTKLICEKTRNWLATYQHLIRCVMWIHNKLCRNFFSPLPIWPNIYSTSFQAPVSKEKTKATASKINAYAYVECSAKYQRGVQEVFETAAKAALTKNRPSIIHNVIRCCILWNFYFRFITKGATKAFVRVQNLIVRDITM